MQSSLEACQPMGISRGHSARFIMEETFLSKGGWRFFLQYSWWIVLSLLPCGLPGHFGPALNPDSLPPLALGETPDHPTPWSRTPLSSSLTPKAPAGPALSSLVLSIHRYTAGA